MDPSIVKLLEEDEDESMHSGADVDAFQAALNRDIEGVFLQGGQTGVGNTQKHDWHSSEMEQKHHVSVSESQQQQLNDNSQEFNHHRQSSAEEMAARSSQPTGNSVPVHEPGRINSSQPSDSQYLKLQKISNQQASGTQPSSLPVNRGKQVPFAMLLPALLSQLDPDRAMQPRTLYGQLKKNEIAKEGFVRHLKNIVGDKVLTIAVQKLNAQLNSQAPQRQSQFTGSQSLSQLQQKGSSSPADPSIASGSAGPMATGSSISSSDNNSQKSQDLEFQSDSRGVIGSHVSGSVNQDRERSSMLQQQQQQQQQHLHFPQSSLPMYGSNNYHPYSGPNVNTPGSSVKPQSHDTQLRQINHNQNMGSTQGMNAMTGSKFERPNPMNDSNRLQSGSLSPFTNNSSLLQNPVSRQLATSKEHNPSLLSSMPYGKNDSGDQGNEQKPKLHFPTQHGLSAAQGEQGNTNSSYYKGRTWGKAAI